jgi:pantothenate kinase
MPHPIGSAPSFDHRFVDAASVPSSPRSKPNPREKQAVTDHLMAAPTNRGSDPAPKVTEATIADLVARARRLISTGKRSILGITGTPGAGKSTICAALLSELASEAVLVEMDGFHLADRELRRLGRQERKGAPDTFDVDGYVALLQRLKAQGDSTIYAPVFDRGLEEPIGSAVPVSADTPLVITEGNYLLLEDGGWDAVRSCLDAVWFMDIEPQVRAERLVRRRQSFGHSDSASRTWVETVDERNAEVVDNTRGRADLVVSIRDFAPGSDPRTSTNEDSHGSSSTSTGTTPATPAPFEGAPTAQPHRKEHGR